MTAKDMQYAVRIGLNKLDSQKYRELRIQEVDWVLTEAQLTTVKKYIQSFQFDRIRKLVITEEVLPCTLWKEDTYKAELPSNFLSYVSGHVLIAKNGCSENVKADLIPKQHIDIHVDSKLDDSSFEWRQVNYNFSKDEMLLYSDGTFIILEPHITFVRVPERIVSLESGYKLPSGQNVTYQDCELHESIHQEIVDLAILIASTNLQMKDIQIKQQKVKLN